MRCERPQHALEPLIRAHDRVRSLLDPNATSVVDLETFREARELRHQLLGDVTEPTFAGAFVAALNRLKARIERPCAVAFDGLDRADEASCALLCQIVDRGGWLELPLLLGFTAEPTGAASELLETVGQRWGEDAVFHVASVSPDAVEAPALPVLPAEVRTVLRAGAQIGPAFEADLVAMLLREDALYVLERLQEAVDLGVPLVDHGDDRFSIAEATSGELRESTLPSLATAWNRRLAALLARTMSSPEEGDGAEGGSTPVANGSERKRGVGPRNSPSRVVGQVGASRVATHHVQAGEHVAAVRRYLQAAREEAAIGAHRGAVAHCEKALDILSQQPLEGRVASLAHRGAHRAGLRALAGAVARR